MTVRFHNSSVLAWFVFDQWCSMALILNCFASFLTPSTAHTKAYYWVDMISIHLSPFFITVLIENFINFTSVWQHCDYLLQYIYFADCNNSNAAYWCLSCSIPHKSPPETCKGGGMVEICRSTLLSCHIFTTPWWLVFFSYVTSIVPKDCKWFWFYTPFSISVKFLTLSGIFFSVIHSPFLQWTAENFVVMAQAVM